ncbi:MAG TPA: hypothetical protein VIM41_11145 [Gammaproteobacteria bacterium]
MMSHNKALHPARWTLHTVHFILINRRRSNKCLLDFLSRLYQYVAVMKRRIIYLLIITVLLAPMAWALDMHESAMKGHSDVALTNIAFDADSNSHDAEQNDHCDHGLAHLITLLAPQPQCVVPALDRTAIAWQDSFTSVWLSPPHRPPIL